MLATWITSQLVFDGVVTGMVIGLLAMGIVLIYRSTKVINFAVVSLGIPSSSLLALMVFNYGFPFWPALIIALIVGTLLGAVMELAVIRRLFSAPRVVVLVATIGISQLLIFIPFQYPNIDASPSSRYPAAFTNLWEDVGPLRQVTAQQITILVIVPLISLLLAWFLNKTTFGQTVAASADNPDLARLSGISPKVVSTVVWTIAGFLATISTVLLSGESGSVAGIINLGPLTMVRALAAAVIGGMRSFPAAMAAGVVIGISQAVLRFNYIDQPGLIDFVLFIVIVIAVFFQGRREGDDSSAYSFVPKSNPVPERLKELAIVRNFVPVVAIVSLLVAIVLPILVTTPSRQLLYARILAYAVCGLSVTVITGWSGQIALGQMAFAGLGALIAAYFHREGLPFIHAEEEGLPFVVSMFAGAAVVALIAAFVGVGALRIRGLMLAVSTFAFGLASQQYLYKTETLSGGSPSAVKFKRGELFGIDLGEQQNYYWFCLAVLVVVTALVVRIRKSGVGRSTIAVRDNENTASAYTVEPTLIKLRAFSIAGFIAGLGGAMIGGLVQNIPLGDRFFQSGDSLAIVAMVVIGGIGSVFGAIVGALWVVGLPALAPDSDVVPFLSSTVGLLLVLLYFPGGLAQRMVSVREMFFNWLAKRLPETENKTVTSTSDALGKVSFGENAATPATLRTDSIEVNFGGNRAVNNVSIEVNDGEVVGLIGTNGAGKSTLMNAIGGFVPATGEVHFGGKNVSNLSSAKRARMGLGRTFQAATLFPELTVRETVMVALEARGHTGLLSTALFYPPAIAAERARKQNANDLIDFLGLGRYADNYISDLSTGTRRIVELAGLLALDARVLCLDEPTAGVAQRETEAFGPLLLEIRKELSASILVIEHDMPLIMSISDRVYCLEAGTVIAEGEPEAVRNNPLVVASYLGTDDRAIERSDS